MTFTYDCYGSTDAPPGRWFVLAIEGIKGRDNFGSIMRLALNFGAASVHLINHRFRRTSTDTTKVERHVPVVESDAIPRFIGATHVYVECTEGATDLRTFTHPKHAVYIFGPEDGSVVVPEGKRVVRIPTCGCTNIAVAVGILLYDRMLKEKTP